jgi:hypothetical protein
VENLKSGRRICILDKNPRLEILMASADEFGSTETRQPRVSTYLVQAILTTLLFLPVGIVALIYSLNTSSKLNQGDVEGARASSESARAWAITAYWLGVIVTTMSAIGVYLYISYFRVQG